MEIFTTTTPSTPLAPAAASTAALVAFPCATSAHATTLRVAVQGICARAWDGVDVTAGKRWTAAGMGLGFAVATTTTPGSHTWSPPI